MTSPQPTHEIWRCWYEVVRDDSLRQGDIFRDILAFWLPEGLPLREPSGEDQITISVQYQRGAWIVMTASCDLERNNRGHVLLSRVIEATAANLNNVQTEKERLERLEVMRRGFDPLRYLLAEHAEEPQLPLSFVGYRTQVLLPIKYLRRNCAGQRLRLRSPHRERFGVWAGANLSRVGLEDAEQIRFPGKTFVGPAQVLRSVEGPRQQVCERSVRRRDSQGARVRTSASR